MLQADDDGNDKNSKESLQSSLNDLIVSLLRKRRKLHYFQGYHDIVTVIFLTLPSELQLPCIEKLSLHRVRDSMGPTLEPVLGLLRIMRNLLRVVDPQYAGLLERYLVVRLDIILCSSCFLIAFRPSLFTPYQTFLPFSRMRYPPYLLSSMSGIFCSAENHWQWYG